SASLAISSPLPASMTCACDLTAVPISAAVRSTPALSLSAQITFAPSAASASALALPMPEAAPSTTAVLPDKSKAARPARRRSPMSFALMRLRCHAAPHGCKAFVHCSRLWLRLKPRVRIGSGFGVFAMPGKDNMRTGGEILVDQLAIHGVRQAFCVPGESYLAALDAFYDRDIPVTVCRHESAAAIAAEAIGKATGRPGICFVTRGPGATNASAGIHIARQDSTPLIVFVVQVARSMRERDAFQELDYRAVFGSICKFATDIDDPARIPEVVSYAFHIACQGRPGPVVVALPEDMLTERVAVPDAKAFEPAETWPGATDMSRLQKMLWAS